MKVAKAELVNYLREHNIVDLRLIPISDTKDSTKSLVQGRIVLEQDGTVINHAEIVRRICSYALWLGERDAVRPDCDKMARDSRRVTLSGEQTLDEIRRYEWDTESRW